MTFLKESLRLNGFCVKHYYVLKVSDVFFRKRVRSTHHYFPLFMYQELEFLGRWISITFSKL